MSASRPLLILLLFLFQKNVYAQSSAFILNEAISSLPHIGGQKQNSDYLCATAGNRLYCIGNQSGGFPDVGFHVPGEMGGIWQQPVKLMDGFGFTIRDKGTNHFYNPAWEQYIAYPFLAKFLYSTKPEGISVVQTQFVPDNIPALVVEYKIQNNSSRDKKITFEWRADINLMPVWLGERIGIVDSPDRFVSFDRKRSILTFKDGNNDWYTGIQSDNPATRLKEIKKSVRKSKGITGVMEIDLDLPAGSSKYLHIYISGSSKSNRESDENLTYVSSRLKDLFQIKKKRYGQIEKTAEIILPDTGLQTAYTWGKYATDWLQRDIPGTGRGLSAGLPDYPWFFSNDQAGTFMALTGTMPPQLFYDAYHTLKKISDKANDHSGRIIHEVSANGVVYNKGNMQESQLHIIAAWEIFKWTGNIAFLKENYAFAKRTWNWLQQHDTNQNGYIEGYGGVEIEGLNEEMLDVQINTCLFLEVFGQMAAILGEPENSRSYLKKAEILKEKINREWWVESEHCYADFLSSKEKALQIIDNALAKRVSPQRNRWAQEKLNSLKNSILQNKYPYHGYLVYYNAGGLQPATAGMVDTSRALQMIRRYTYFTNKFGSYIAGIERPDDITIDERSFQKDSNFTYNRAVMPAATAGLIIAAARYGMPDTALLFIHRMLNTFSYATPGTTYEVSPDYGMFVQAWNITCLNMPLIHYFFGINPDAYKKEITIHLQMPSQWKEASLNNLLIGNARFSIQYKKENQTIRCTLQSSEPGWKLHLMTGEDRGPVNINNKVLNNAAEWISVGTDPNIIEYETGK